MPDAEVHSYFDYVIDNSRKLQRAKCKRCSAWEIAKNTNRQRAHLLVCSGYAEWMRSKGVKSSITRDEEQAASNPPALGQTFLQTTNFITHAIPAQLKKELDSAFAMAVYTGGRPFSIFDSPQFRDAFKLLGYVPPDKKTLGGHLLDACYNRVRDEVVAKIIQPSQFLNFVADESTNVAGERVLNMCILTPDGYSFHWVSESARAMSMNAQNAANWMYDKMMSATNNDNLKINFVATDTCSTMRLAWQKLSSRPALSHTFFVPCDFHGLQLCIKDILMLLGIKPLWNQASNIVTGFSKAFKQLGILREIQMQLYKHRKALISSGLTRWGTQVNLIKSIQGNKQTLRAWCIDERASAQAFTATLLSTSFWNSLDDLNSILEPIHEEQKLSEANGSTLEKVFHRWGKIQTHLHECQNNASFGQAISAFLYNDPQKVWAKRLDKQLAPIHIVAAALMPNQHDLPLTATSHKSLHEFIIQYAGRDAARQYLRFRSRTDEFNPAVAAWDYVDEPLNFWRYQVPHAPEIAGLAIRLLQTPAISVPSERAFSTMNQLQTKSRNRMRIETLDKLQFIYINTRSLELIRTKAPARDLELSEEQLIALEDESIDAAVSILGKRKRSDSQAQPGDRGNIVGEEIDFFAGDSDDEAYGDGIGGLGGPGNQGPLGDHPHPLAVRLFP